MASGMTSKFPYLTHVLTSEVVLSRYFTSPGLPLPRYVENFQSNKIPIDGEVVARLCVERLSLAYEVDD